MLILEGCDTTNKAILCCQDSMKHMDPGSTASSACWISPVSERVLYIVHMVTIYGCQHIYIIFTQLYYNQHTQINRHVYIYVYVYVYIYKYI